MPFLPAVIGAIAAAGLSGAVIGGITITALGASLIGGLITIASTFALAPILGGGASEVGRDQARGVTQNISNPIGPLPVIYGRYRLAGSRVYVHTTGATNEFMHLVIAWCEGEIDAIEEIYFDDVISSDGRYAGLVTVTHYLGTDSQTANAALIAASPHWTSAHRLRGVAYSYFKLEYDPEAFPNIPVVSAVIRGRKVANVTTAAVAWSQSPADCIYDYMTNTRYGRSIPAAEINLASFQTARANFAATITNPPEPSQATYTLDGVIDIDQLPLDNLRAMLSSCRAMMPYTGGQYRLIGDQAEASVFDFDTANMVGGLSITLDSKEGRFNRVKANYYNDDRQWQPDLVISDSTTYRTADNGTLLVRDIQLPFTTDFYRARRIAHLELKQSRATIACSFSALLDGLRAEVGSVVQITHPTPGWVSKKFRVLGIELDSIDTVKITAREYDTIYSPTAPPTRPGVTVITLPPPNKIEDSVNPDNFDITAFWQYSFEGGDVQGWAQNDGSIAANADACVGLVAGLVTHGGGGNVASASIPLSQAFVQTALAVAGRQIRVQMFAKQPAANAAAGFKFRLVGSSASSPWQTFTTTAGCVAYGYVWRPASAQTSITLQVQGDSNNAGTMATLIDNVAAWILPDFINAANISTWIDTLAVGSAYIADLAVLTAKIANLAVTTGKINDLAVTTLKIGDQQVTFPLTVEVASHSVAGNSGGAWVNITGASLTLPAAATGTRGKVIVMVSCSSLRPIAAGNDFAYMRVTRDGSAISYNMAGIAYIGFPEIVSPAIILIDTPNNSAHTYRVQRFHDDSFSVKDLVMVLIEAKK